MAITPEEKACACAGIFVYIGGLLLRHVKIVPGNALSQGRGGVGAGAAAVAITK